MDKETLHNIKESLNNCALVIELLILPIFILFIILMTTTSIVSSDTAKQLNLTFINIIIVAYTYYIIPIVAVISTIKIVLKFDNTEKALIKIAFSAITEFMTVALIFCNFQLSVGVEVLNIETGLYYTATSMIEFIAISFLILGSYIIYTKIKKHIVNNKSIKNKEDNNNK